MKSIRLRKKKWQLFLHRAPLSTHPLMVVMTICSIKNQANHHGILTSIVIESDDTGSKYMPTSTMASITRRPHVGHTLFLVQKPLLTPGILTNMPMWIPLGKSAGVKMVMGMLFPVIKRFLTWNIFYNKVDNDFLFCWPFEVFWSSSNYPGTKSRLSVCFLLNSICDFRS